MAMRGLEDYGHATKGPPPTVTNHYTQLHRGEISHMAEQSGTGPYTDEEWEYASQRVQAIREQATTNPVAADAEARKYAEITNRVQTSRATTSHCPPATAPTD